MQNPGGDILTIGDICPPAGWPAAANREVQLPRTERMNFVSQTTKRALGASLKKLLLQKPLNKITINDITEDCGVNRMTFYYHFKDIYDLVDWLLEEDAQKLLENGFGYEKWNDIFLQILQQVQENRTLVLNVYRSIGREQVEQYLYRMLDPALCEFIDRESQGIDIQDEDKQFIVDLYKYAIVGVLLEWIRKDMKEEPEKIAGRLNMLLHGSARQAVYRCRANNASIKIC